MATKKKAKKPEEQIRVTVQIQGSDPRIMVASTAGELRAKMDGIDDTYIMSINGHPVRRPSDPLRSGNFVTFTTKTKHA